MIDSILDIKTAETRIKLYIYIYIYQCIFCEDIFRFFKAIFCKNLSISFKRNIRIRNKSPVHLLEHSFIMLFFVVKILVYKQF